MNILRRTPRTDMIGDAIRDKMATFHKQLAEELGISLLILDDYLVAFARLSTRVSFEPSEVDFAPAMPTDAPQQITEKFMAYLDTKCMATVEQAQREIEAADQRPNPLAPGNAPAGDADFLAAVISGETATESSSEKK